MSRNRYNKPPQAEGVIQSSPDPFTGERVLSVLRSGKPTVLKQKINMRSFPVCWGIPMDEICYSIFFSNFAHMRVMPWDFFSITMSTYLLDARNAIHNSFLEMKNCNWLIMMDSDVLAPPDFPDRMLAHNKLVVGGWYRKKGGDNPPVVYDYSEKDGGWFPRKGPGQGLEKVDGAGAGCWMMHRKAAEALGRDPFGKNIAGGEDFELCKKLRAAGIDIWIDWNTPCAHAGVAFV